MPVEVGVVAGEVLGGRAHVLALDAFHVKGLTQDEAVGYKIVKRSLEEPMRQIVSNAGGEASVVVNKVTAGEGNFGFNAGTGEYGDMIKMGVIGCGLKAWAMTTVPRMGDFSGFIPGLPAQPTKLPGRYTWSPAAKVDP